MITLTISMIGLFVSLYIYHKKRQHRPLMCPRKADCNTVINSTFSKTFGIPNEVVGIIYYTLMLGVAGIAILSPDLLNPFIRVVLLVANIAAALFSLYLIALQAFVIRSWCMWCLVSACVNVLLATIGVASITSEMYSLIGDTRTFWIIVHSIGFILGVGSATVTDVLFFRFLKDGTISPEEKGIMDTISNVIWVGLVIAILSGLMLYLPEQARLQTSSKFLLKLVVVSVITINGFLLNFLVAPRMIQFSFDATVPAGKLRRLAFALGGISIVSWYIAFILGSLRKIPLTSYQGIVLYAAVLVCIIGGSQLYERFLLKKTTLRIK